MIYALVFSKSRPMQLQACLESLLYYTGIPPQQVFIILADPEKYTKESFCGCGILPETKSFDATLRAFIMGVPKDSVVLCVVDDTIFHAHVDYKLFADLNKLPKHIGISLRLGFNTNCIKYEPISSTWDWTKEGQGHGNYCFEVSSSIYRISLLRDIMKHCKPFKIPNNLEDWGFYYVKKKYKKQPFYCHFPGNSICSTQSMNRVQSDYPNPINGDEETTAEKLLEMYKEGWRIDWKAYEGTAPGDPFLLKKDLKLKRGA